MASLGLMKPFSPVLKSSGFNRNSVLATLQPDLSGIEAPWNEAQRRELADLGRESDPEIFWRGLLDFGRRLETGDRLGEAARVYAAILQNSEGTPGSGKEISRQAELRLETMRGQGTFGARTEFLLRRLASDSLDPKLIAPMMVASMAFSLTRTAILGRLLSSTSSAWYTRGLGSRLAAGAFAFSAETAGFILSERALHRLGVNPETGSSLGRELASTVMTLGAMKLAAWASDRTLAALEGGLASGRVASIIPHVATLSGLLVARQGEEYLGLRARSQGESGVLDALVTMVNLKAGTALGHGLLGNRLLAFQGELEARTQLAQLDSFRSGNFKGLGLGSPVLSVLGPPSLERKSPAVEAPADLKGITEPMRMAADSPSAPSSRSKIGTFLRRTVAGVSVYSPVLAGEAAPEAGKGTVILTSGAGGNHTSFGEIPQQLARLGWQVHCVVFPGYENPSDISSLRGGGRKADRLADKWERSVRAALYDLILEHSDGPLFLGGFSMGAAGTLLTYSQLPPEMKEAVSGLILAAPAVNVKALSSPSRLRNWMMRNLALPSMSLLGLEFQKEKKGIESDLQDEVEVAMRVPRAANHGSVLLIERAKESTEMLMGEDSLPKVLLVHSGNGDSTVDESSVAFLREVFASQIKHEILLPSEEGHYVLVGKHRNLAQRAILEFLGERR